MSDPTEKGYDSAQAQREQDDLDRWRFAADIVDVVLATPSDWSARIGIFGKWGEGKSTVLQFAESMLREEGSVVFTFSPWAIQSWNDLWQEFGNRLSEALSAAGIPFDNSWKKTLKSSSRWLESTGVGQIVESTAGLLGKEKLYHAAFGALAHWLKYDGAQIRAIRKKLGDQRLVVLIDDLDRCAPELIPQLLLSLRELLDLPGFTFVLAFDDEIVARSLTDKNPAWVEGANFLEKILDFRFHLPTITEAQKERLVSRAMTRYCPFVPAESTEKIQDLLPNNPRKLKSLIRSLASLRPQISRHDPEEMNWTDMWLAQMLRLESYSFFELLLQGENLEEEAGFLYSARSSLRPGNREENSNQGLQALLKKAGIQETGLVQRLTQLIEAARSRSSLHFRYMCELALRPHAVTWKEFRLLRTKWDSDRRPEVLGEWIAKHAVDRGVSTDDVEGELFDAILGKRTQVLSAAAESKSIEELELESAEASTLLEMLEQFLLGLGKLTAARFEKLYGQASYWIGFRRNAGDQLQRRSEESLLLKLLASAPSSLSTDLLDVLLPGTWDLNVGDGSFELRQALREECRAIVAPKAAKVAIAFLSENGGIRSLTEQGRFHAVKFCLFDPRSPVWQTDLKSELLHIIRRGGEERSIYLNVRDLFDLIVQGLDRGIDSVGSRDIRTLLSNVDFVRSLWRTVTSRPIQYRMQSAFVTYRQRLIANGVPEVELPLTDELRARLEEQTGQHEASASSDSTIAVPEEEE